MKLTARQKLTFGRRLQKLHTLLGDIKPAQYAHEAFLRKYDPKHVDCGTVACTLGWAVASKRFRGLKLTPYKCALAQWTITTVEDFADITDVANVYFGPGVYARVFDVYAFGRTSKGEVTPNRVRERIREVAQEQFGFAIPA